MLGQSETVTIIVQEFKSILLSINIQKINI